MSDVISWNLELAVKEGQLEAFRELMGDMVAHVQSNEPGTLVYEWYVSDDGTAVHIYERYTDSDALMAHMAGFGEHFAERFLAAIDPTDFSVYGNASDTVKETLSGFGAKFMEPFGGFAR